MLLLLRAGGAGAFGKCELVKGGVCTGDKMKRSDCPPCFEFEG